MIRNFQKEGYILLWLVVWQLQTALALRMSVECCCCVGICCECAYTDDVCFTSSNKKKRAFFAALLAAKEAACVFCAKLRMRLEFNSLSIVWSAQSH